MRRVQQGRDTEQAGKGIDMMALAIAALATLATPALGQEQRELGALDQRVP
jgi:hypothetical protein